MPEQPVDFYDAKYRDGYAYERYVPIYDWIAARVREPVLDLGCGAGFLASILDSRGVRDYTGVDFSPVALQQARARAGAPYRFILADLAEINLDAYRPFSTVVLCEVLEHITVDVELAEKIPQGTKVLGSVPTIGGRDHIRSFPEKESVLERYEKFFRFAAIERIPPYWWVFDAESLARR